MKHRKSQVKACALEQLRGWPPGATAGVMLVALCCAALAGGMYQVLGPSDAFAQESAPISWSPPPPIDR